MFVTRDKIFKILCQCLQVILIKNHHCSHNIHSALTLFKSHLMILKESSPAHKKDTEIKYGEETYF